MPKRGDPLSQREVDVLRMLVGGALRKEIAAKLNVSPGTVTVHAMRARMKIGAPTVEALTARVAAIGLEHLKVRSPLTPERIIGIRRRLLDYGDDES